MTMMFGQERDAILDRLEGWELVEFLQIPIEDLLFIAEQEEWINDDNIDDLLDFVGLRKDKEDNE